MTLLQTALLAVVQAHLSHPFLFRIALVSPRIIVQSGHWRTPQYWQKWCFSKESHNLSGTQSLDTSLVSYELRVTSLEVCLTVFSSHSKTRINRSFKSYHIPDLRKKGKEGTDLIRKGPIKCITVVAESSETCYSGSAAPQRYNMRPRRGTLKSTWQLVLNLSLYYTTCCWHKRAHHILFWYLTLQGSWETISEDQKRWQNVHPRFPGVCRSKFSTKQMNFKFCYPFTCMALFKALILISQFYICNFASRPPPSERSTLRFCKKFYLVLI